MPEGFARACKVVAEHISDIAAQGWRSAQTSRVARFGRIDRSIGEPPCARRCRRTDAGKRKGGRSRVGDDKRTARRRAVRLLPGCCAPLCGVNDSRGTREGLSVIPLGHRTYLATKV